jgi:hypothetical protein
MKSSSDDRLKFRNAESQNSCSFNPPDLQICKLQSPFETRSAAKCRQSARGKQPVSRMSVSNVGVSVEGSGDR